MKIKFTFNKMVLILSMILIILTVYFRISLSMDSLDIAVNEKFDTKKFYEKNKFFSSSGKLKLTSEYLAIFLFTTDDCNPCLKELKSMSDFIDLNFTEEKINKILIIADKNINKARWYSRFINFNIETMYGYDQEYIKVLEKFEEIKLKRQLIIVNLETNTIVRRIKLVKGKTTSIDEKKSLFRFLK